MPFRFYKKSCFKNLPNVPMSFCTSIFLYFLMPIFITYLQYTIIQKNTNTFLTSFETVLVCMKWEVNCVVKNDSRLGIYLFVKREPNGGL